MTVNIQYVDVDVSEALSTYTNGKLEKLSNKYEFLINAEVYFKKEENEHNKGKICNIELSLPGPRIFATSNEKNYEMAVKETINDIERQLKKRKQVFKPY